MSDFSDYWTQDKIEILRALFFKKWKSMKGGEPAWSEYLSQHRVFVMGPKHVSATLNNRRPVLCLENPTLGDRYERDEIMSKDDVVDEIEAGVRSKYWDLLKDEAWYLIPEAFARKAIILGLP